MGDDDLRRVAGNEAKYLAMSEKLLKSSLTILGVLRAPEEPDELVEADEEARTAIGFTILPECTRLFVGVEGDERHAACVAERVRMLDDGLC